MSLLSKLFGRRQPPAPQSDRLTEIPPDPGAWKPLPTGRLGQARHMPPGEWVKATLTMPIVGIPHRRAAAEAFVRQVIAAERRGARYGIDLRPEPENPHDANAIRVYGIVGASEWHIGFLDAGMAKELNEDLISKGVPIAGELYQIWVGDTGYLEIKVIVLAPPGNSDSARRKRRAAREASGSSD